MTYRWAIMYGKRDKHIIEDFIFLTSDRPEREAAEVFTELNKTARSAGYYPPGGWIIVDPGHEGKDIEELIAEYCDRLDRNSSSIEDDHPPRRASEEKAK